MNDRVVRRLVWILAGIVLFFVVAAVVQWLWNCIIPWVIGFPPVTYWQAAGLLLLTRILFGFPLRVAGPGCRCGCRGTDRDTDSTGGGEGAPRGRKQPVRRRIFPGPASEEIIP